jgi:hypothetical protein
MLHSGDADYGTCIFLTARLTNNEHNERKVTERNTREELGTHSSTHRLEMSAEKKK